MTLPAKHHGSTAACYFTLHTGMCGGKSFDVVFVSACCTIANERY